MFFETDNQTLSDLAIFSSHKSKPSVYGLFNHTKTVGGQVKLDKLFRNPISDPAIIAGRIAVLRFLESYGRPAIRLDREKMDFAESYLNRASYPDQLVVRLRRLVRSSNEDYLLERGCSILLELIGLLENFLEGAPEEGGSALFDELATDIRKAMKQLDVPAGWKETKELNLGILLQLHALFRKRAKEAVVTLIERAYELDMYFALLETKKQYRLNYPEIADGAGVDIRGLRHPLLPEGAVANDIRIEPEQNLCLITGANMAGKSTLMKAFGVALYLAHLGLPVPAEGMRFTVMKGLYATINLADSTALGHSHFYAEVQRVKFVMEQLKEQKNLIVICDELFRGTNVKDAYEATVAVIEALASVKRSVFLISSHIIEAAEQLQEVPGIQFSRFATEIRDDDTFHYSYKLLPGISDERLGMLILKKEKIFELLNPHVREKIIP